MLRFSLASLLVIVTLVALACAAIMNPNVYFATGLRFLLLTLVPGSVLVAAICRDTQQRLAIGFALFVIGTQVSTWLFADPMGFHNRASSAIAQFHGSTNVAVPTAYPVYGWSARVAYPPGNLSPTVL